MFFYFIVCASFTRMNEICFYWLQLTRKSPQLRCGWPEGATMLFQLTTNILLAKITLQGWLS